jgi:hypothetical protein
MIMNIKGQQEVRELLIAAGAGEATQQQLDRLNELVSQDAALQEYAAMLLVQIGSVRWAAHQNVATSLTAIGSCFGDNQPSGESTNSYSSLQRANCAPARFSWRDEFGLRESLRRMCGSRIAWTTATAVALLLVAGLWWQQIDRGNEAISKGAPRLVAGAIRPGAGIISVDSGTMRMPLPNVGYVIVDGPAKFELESPKRLRVDRGRIKVRVTEQAGHGFVVATPHGEVTDLGTEFGIEVGDENTSDLVVFEGQVDLRTGAAKTPVERLIGGEGVSFAKDGQLNRIMSISTNGTATFQRLPGVRTANSSPLILNVTDTLLTDDTKRFYEIVPAGFGEDALAYVDRPYEWNGIDKAGLPGFLRGADYVKTFNDHKLKSFQLSVEVSRSVDLYLFWDERVEPAEWLESDFIKTDSMIALDTGGFPSQRPSARKLGKGPGEKVDYRYTIWRRHVNGRGVVQLGSLQKDDQDESISMYGIAAVAIGEPKGPSRAQNTIENWKSRNQADGFVGFDTALLVPNRIFGELSNEVP